MLQAKKLISFLTAFNLN